MMSYVVLPLHLYYYYPFVAHYVCWNKSILWALEEMYAQSFYPVANSYRIMAAIAIKQIKLWQSIVYYPFWLAFLTGPSIHAHDQTWYSSMLDVWSGRECIRTQHVLICVNADFGNGCADSVVIWLPAV